MRLILLLFICFSSNATEMSEIKKRKKINVYFIKVAPGASTLRYPNQSGSFELIARNGVIMDLFCEGVRPEHYARNKFNNDIKDGDKISELVYRNFGNIEVGDFKFSNHLICNELTLFLEAVFEFIDEEHFVHFVLDTERMEISKINLPEIDPYLDRMPTSPREKNIIINKRNLANH